MLFHILYIPNRHILTCCAVVFQENQFWRLLASILQTAGIVSCEASAQLGGGQSHCLFDLFMAFNAIYQYDAF